MTQTNSDTVRASFAAFLAQNRKTAEQLLADDLVFTSPQDDHIDKAAFLERCFPTADRFASHDILELVPAGSGVLVLYEYELKAGDATGTRSSSRSATDGSPRFKSSSADECPTTDASVTITE